MQHSSSSSPCRNIDHPTVSLAITIRCYRHKRENLVRLFITDLKRISGDNFEKLMIGEGDLVYQDDQLQSCLQIDHDRCTMVARFRSTDAAKHALTTWYPEENALIASLLIDIDIRFFPLSQTIWIGNLAKIVTQQELRELIGEEVGDISMQIARYETNDRQSAIIHLHSTDSSVRIHDRLQNHSFHGYNLIVEFRHSLKLRTASVDHRNKNNDNKNHHHHNNNHNNHNHNHNNNMEPQESKCEETRTRRSMSSDKSDRSDQTSLSPDSSPEFHPSTFQHQDHHHHQPLNQHAYHRNQENDRHRERERERVDRRRSSQSARYEPYSTNRLIRNSSRNGARSPPNRDSRRLLNQTRYSTRSHSPSYSSVSSMKFESSSLFQSPSPSPSSSPQRQDSLSRSCSRTSSPRSQSHSRSRSRSRARSDSCFASCTESPWGPASPSATVNQGDVVDKTYMPVDDVQLTTSQYGEPDVSPYRGHSRIDKLRNVELLSPDDVLSEEDVKEIITEWLAMSFSRPDYEDNPFEPNKHTYDNFLESDLNPFLQQIGLPSLSVDHPIYTWFATAVAFDDWGGLDIQARSEIQITPRMRALAGDD